MADREPNRVEGPHRPSRWISGHLFIALLTILLAAGMWVRTHTHAPQGSGTASVLRSDETEPPTTAPTSHPSTAPAILTQPATTEVFSEEYITSASTALVRSDGQGGAIYEPIDEGTALTIFDDPATHASDELVRARMNSGVEGRVPAGRLKGVRVRKLVLLPPPAVEPIAPAALGGMARVPGVQVNAVDSKNVQRAIDIGLKFLLGAQRSNGSWEPLDAPVAGAADGSLHGGQWGFASGLASEALLAAGQTPGAPAVRGALNWLTSAPMKGTYAVSARDRFMDRYLASASTTLQTKSARSIF